MKEAYIVAARRTASGRRNGRLSAWHPVDLGAQILNDLVDSTGVDPAAIDDVIVGCVSQVGEQARQVGRYMVLASTLPESVPAVTIDRQCGSSQQAIHFAAQAVMSGVMDIVIAAGVESMSRVPMGSPGRAIEGSSSATPTIRERFGVNEFSQFQGAELLAKKWGFTRRELDTFGLESHTRAIHAVNSGAFKNETLAIPIVLEDGTEALHEVDEGIRFDATLDGMSQVKLINDDGMITAATSSQIADGAAGLMIASAAAVKQHGLTPLARIVNMTVTAGDPVIMLEEPLFATDKALKKAGLTIDDIDLFEVNEAFAPVPMAWLKHTGADLGKLNVNGGAIALGHPLGATGAKLMTTLVHSLHRRKQRYGLQTMCEGAGTANVTIVEALLP